MKETGTSYNQKSVQVDKPGKKRKKNGQEQKILIAASAKFLAHITKVLFLK